MSPADEAVEIGSLVDTNAELRREVAELQDQLSQYAQPGSGAEVAAMQKDRDQLRMATGAVAVQGPGVEVSVSGYIRPEELGDLVNELRNAGAEVIEVNNHRLGARSIFQATRAGYSVDGTILSPPFLFQAIGASSTLDTALRRQGGVVALLRAYYPSLTFDVTQRGLIEIAALQPILDAQATA